MVTWTDLIQYTIMLIAFGALLIGTYKKQYLRSSFNCQILKIPDYRQSGENIKYSYWQNVSQHQWIYPFDVGFFGAVLSKYTAEGCGANHCYLHRRT